MAALTSRCGYYMLQLWFRLLLFPRLFSAVANWMSIILPHMMWPYCEFRMQVRNVLMCYTRLAENTERKKHAKNRRLCTIAQICWAISSQRRRLSTIGKNLLNSNIVSISSYNMVNFGPLTAEIGSGVLGTSANCNGFRILASLLQRRQSVEVNQTLHDVWPSPELVHYIYIFGAHAA